MDELIVPLVSLAASVAGIIFVRRQMAKLHAQERRDAELAEQFAKASAQR